MEYLLIIFLMIISPDVFASRARMHALNQDPHRGTYYFEDNRNIFRNPADLNLFESYATFELEFIPRDESFSLVPQGGYFTEFSGFPVGIYLGQGMIEGFLLSQEVFSATPSNLFLSTDDSNPINFFFGGGGRLQWGFVIHLVNAKETFSQNTSTYRGISMGAGVNIEDFSVYGNLVINEKSIVSGPNLPEDGTMEREGFILGGIYKWGNTSILVDYIEGSIDLTGRVEPSQNGYAKISILSLGIGHLKKLGVSTLNFNINYEIEKKENSTKNEKSSEDSLPLVLGFEKEANSWLVLRGSVAQDVFIGEGHTKVNFGGTFNFGKLKIDGNLGMNDVSLVNTNAFFVNASITYYF